jgi:hypothetical protein
VGCVFFSSLRVLLSRVEAPPGQPPWIQHDATLTLYNFYYHFSYRLMVISRCTNCGIKFDSPKKRRYCDFCREDLLREKSRSYRADLKKEFLSAYGHRCQCPCGCLQTEPDYLGLAHIFGDGARHRARVGGAGYYTYQDLKNRGWPKDGFRIECFNCNFSKRIRGDGKCPREIKY